MGALAEGLGIAPGSLTGVVDRLIDKGLVNRERSEADRRKVMVGLSPEGEKAFSRFREAAAKFSDSLLSLLKPEESETLLQLMEKLVKGLENHEGGGPHSGRGGDRSEGNLE
jgi:DNA-binding MarR family transcriptional regulator